MHKDKWVLKVYNNGEYSYSRCFRTKKLAVDESHKIGALSSQYGFELVKLKPIKLKPMVAGDNEPMLDVLARRTGL